MEFISNILFKENRKFYSSWCDQFAMFYFDLYIFQIPNILIIFNLNVLFTGECDDNKSWHAWISRHWCNQQDTWQTSRWLSLSSNFEACPNLQHKMWGEQSCFDSGYMSCRQLVKSIGEFFYWKPCFLKQVVVLGHKLLCFWVSWSYIFELIEPFEQLTLFRVEFCPTWVSASALPTQKLSSWLPG